MTFIFQEIKVMKVTHISNFSDSETGSVVKRHRRGYPQHFAPPAKKLPDTTS